MANAIEGILGFIAFGSVILSGLADAVLATTWAKFYFTSGLLSFSQCVPIETHHTNIPSVSLLNAKMYSFWMGGFIFGELGTSQYGFRRKFFSFSPRPMMHGQVIFDTENNRIVVNGYLDWFVISFSILWILIAPIMWFVDAGTFTMELLLLWIGSTAFYGLIMGILFLMDYSRLEGISKIAADLWARKYVIHNESV